MNRIKNVFADYAAVKAEVLSTNFTAYNGMYLAKTPKATAEELLLAVNKHGEFEQIESVIRTNDQWRDTQFRIHTDSEIQGQQPSHAVIAYFTTDINTGTAFYSSLTHGDSSKTPKVFIEDDGTWQTYTKMSAKDNTAVLFGADLFHMRYPRICVVPRYVIVSFLKEVI